MKKGIVVKVEKVESKKIENEKYCGRVIGEFVCSVSALEKTMPSVYVQTFLCEL